MYIGHIIMKIKDIANKWLSFHERQGKFSNFAAGFFFAVLVGVLEHFAGKDFSLAIFYLLPTAFTAWFAGRAGGIVISLICAAAWTWAIFSFTGIISLRTLSVFGTFCVISLLVSKIRQMLEHERAASRTDHLTGAVNSRAFNETAQVEIARMTRDQTPLTIVYMDLDNFKAINDGYGHTTGDLLLQTVAESLLKNLRRTDVVARLGGDEFVILLPNTDQEAARRVIPAVMEQLLGAMKDNNWQTTFSVGVLTCITPPRTTDQMITLADNLMYEVKRMGKNSIRYSVHAEETPEGEMKRSGKRRET